LKSQHSDAGFVDEMAVLSRPFPANRHFSRKINDGSLIARIIGLMIKVRT